MSGFLGLILFFIGTLVGALVNRLFFQKPGSTQELNQQLNDISSEFADYQDQVDAHYKTTAELVQNMTQSYAAVHQHLSNGAKNLSRASFESLPHSASQAQEELNKIESLEATENLSAPRDYSEDPQKES